MGRLSRRARKGISEMMGVIIVVAIMMVVAATVFTVVLPMFSGQTLDLSVSGVGTLSLDRTSGTAKLTLRNAGNTDLKICAIFLTWRSQTTPTVNSVATDPIFGVNASVGSPAQPASCNGALIAAGKSITGSISLSGSGFYSGLQAEVTVYVQNPTTQEVSSFSGNVIFR